MAGLAYPANSSFIETTNRFMPFLYGEYFYTKREILDLKDEIKFPINWNSIILLICCLIGLHFLAVGIFFFERCTAKNSTRNSWTVKTYHNVGI